MSPKKRANTCTASGSPHDIAAVRRRGIAALFLAAALVVSPGLGGSQEKTNPIQPSDPAAISPRLAQVRRICIQKLGEEALGAHVQEVVIAKLFEAKRFSLTENCERADFALKGSIAERAERTYRSESEGISFGKSASTSDSGSSAAASVRASDHENLSSSQIKEHAVLTLRLVDKEGEILWAISQESTGGKTKGAIGDAAERAVRRLLREIERAEKQEKAGLP